MLHQGQSDGGESCIVLQADQLVASLPGFRSLHHLQYANFMLQAKNAANKATSGECKTLMPLLLNVVVPEVHRNDRSHAHELSKPTFDSLYKNLAW